MREELEKRIQEAQERLGLRALTEKERARSKQSQEVDAFRGFLAWRMKFTTRAELLLGAEYLWRETGPAVRFTIDNHVFVLARYEDETRFLEEVAGGLMSCSVCRMMNRGLKTGC